MLRFLHVVVSGQLEHSLEALQQKQSIEDQDVQGTRTEDEHQMESKRGK